MVPEIQGQMWPGGVILPPGWVKRRGTARRRAASSCNALAIDSFSSFILYDTYQSLVTSYLLCTTFAFVICFNKEISHCVTNKFDLINVLFHHYSVSQKKVAPKTFCDIFTPGESV